MDSTRRFSIVVAALVTYLLMVSGVIHADEKSDLKCRGVIIKASAAFVQSKIKAFQKCEESKIKGKFTGTCPNDGKAGPKIDKAVTKLRSAIAKGCGGKDKICGTGDTNETLLADTGFPSTCPNFESGSCTGPITNCTHIADCVFCIGEAAVDQAISLYHGEFEPSTADKILNKCQVTISKEAAKFFFAKSKALQKCWDAVNKGKLSGPCPDAAATAKIQAAEAKKVEKINKACTGLTPAQIGFVASCDQVQVPGGQNCGAIGSIDTLAELIDCIDCVTEFKVDCIDLLAAPDADGGAYPSQCNPGPAPTPTTTPLATTTPTPVVTAAPCNPVDNRRCTGNTRTECTTNADCASPGGTCEFFFGAPLPLAAGGVATCVTNQFNGMVTGTFNELNGVSAGTAGLISRVYSAPVIANPCPRCLGDATKNDGAKGGTCESGPNAMQTCDANASHPFEQTFGTISLDCPPDSGGLIASLAIDLTNTTGTVTRTLSAASPNCRAPGFTALKCHCDTCNNGTAQTCDDNTDCPDPSGPIGPICGGTRCIGGANPGAACTAASECPGGACGRPGAATAPNQCDDATCVADAGNEGTCAGGPFDLFCGPEELFRGCTTNADCGFPGDTCGNGRFRECYPDNGVSGNSVVATGVTDPPTTAGDGHNEADPTLASQFCIGPTTSSAVNNAGGIPGLGRLELPGHAVDDSTTTDCPTTITFLPTAGDLGVLDAGWTGQAHDSKVIDCGLVTVSVTSCSNAMQPDCGICTYTGPIPNSGAP